MSDPEIFALNFTAGAELVLLATLTADPAGFSALAFTIRDAWADEDDTDATAVGQLTLGAGIEAVDEETVRITVPVSITSQMLERDYVADLRGKTVTGARDLPPFAIGTLTRLPHAKVGPL